MFVADEVGEGGAVDFQTRLIRRRMAALPT